MAAMPRRMLTAFVVGSLLLGGAAGAAIGSVLDADSMPSGPGSTPASTGGPPCTAAAIRSAIQHGGIDAVSVAGVECGRGWAGASYATAQLGGVALLRALGGQWVVVDRAQRCHDRSIPATVHVYCLVS